MILMKLDIIPGSLVIESGTGSGSLSFSISSVIQDHGHLFTFEFNKERYENGRDIFKKLKKDNITVVWRDSCGEGFKEKPGEEYKLPLVDAVFLDLPKPWEAVVHAAKVLKKGGKICCFSPCIEQVQKTHEALKINGFWEMEMVESLCRNFERKEREVEGEEIKEEEGKAGEENNEKIEMLEEKVEEQEEKNEENQENKEKNSKEKMKKGQKGGNKRKRKEKTNVKKKAFFTTGTVQQKGHTGYLTFATYFQIN